MLKIEDTGLALFTIWLGGYALASLVFSFAETIPVVCASFLVMMISSIRLPYCVAAWDSGSGVAITKTLQAIYGISALGIAIAVFRVISVL